MAKIVTPKNAAGVITYPQTLTKAVYDDNGNMLENILTTKGNTQSFKVDNVAVPITAWVDNTNTQAATQEREDYPFMASVSVDNVVQNDVARVVFRYAEQSGGNYSTNCYTVAGGVIIQAKEKPSEAIALDYILVERVL